MILGLNADTASSTVESPWWSENITGGAQGKLESQMLWIHDLGYLESLDVKEVLCIVTFVLSVGLRDVLNI